MLLFTVQHFETIYLMSSTLSIKYIIIINIIIIIRLKTTPKYAALTMRGSGF